MCLECTIYHITCHVILWSPTEPSTLKSEKQAIFLLRQVWMHTRRSIIAQQNHTSKSSWPPIVLFHWTLFSLRYGCHWVMDSNLALWCNTFHHAALLYRCEVQPQGTKDTMPPSNLRIVTFLLKCSCAGLKLVIDDDALGVSSVLPFLPYSIARRHVFPAYIIIWVHSIFRLRWLRRPNLTISSFVLSISNLKFLTADNIMYRPTSRRWLGKVIRNMAK